MESVISIYGLDVTFPSNSMTKPSSKLGAISISALIYWLLTLGFNFTLFFRFLQPIISIGGKPSF